MKKLLGQFEIPGKYEKARLYGSGLIHQTYLASFIHLGQEERYIVQRVNHHIFTRPRDVMHNIGCVLQQLNKARPESPNLQLVPALNGKNWITDAKGYLWRVYPYIKGSMTVDVAENPAQVMEAAKISGQFFHDLYSLPPEKLHVTIPRFHDLSWRYEQLDKARSKDTAGRTANCREEINQCLKRKELATDYDEARNSGKLPLRVAHHDTKINNVLLDAKTGKGLCLIDLDTVMPGTVVSDFGDMVRTMACTAGEEENDMGNVKFDRERFCAIADGFLSECRDMLSPGEMEWLPRAGTYLTLMQAIRYLTDYLNGDAYYKTAHSGHNLQRCRNQLTLLRDLEKNSGLMEIISGNPKFN